jgi:hypothetical protein
MYLQKYFLWKTGSRMIENVILVLMSENNGSVIVRSAISNAGNLRMEVPCVCSSSGHPIFTQAQGTSIRRIVTPHPFKNLEIVYVKFIISLFN